MLKGMNGSRSARAIFIALIMVFSTFLPIAAEVYGEGSMTEQSKSTFVDAQIIDVPAAEGGRGSHIKEGKELIPAKFSIMSSSMQVNEAVYESVYELGGWESIEFCYKGNTPAIVYTYDKDFINAFMETEKEKRAYSFVMKEKGSDKTIAVTDLHIYVQEDESGEYGIRIMGIPEGVFEAGGYIINFSANLDGVEYKFNEVEQEYYYEDFVYNNTLYLPNHSVQLGADIDALGEYFGQEENYYRVEIRDKQGNVYFTNEINSHLSSELYDDGYSRYDKFLDIHFLRRYLYTDLFMTNEVTTEADKYSLMVYDDATDEEALPYPIKVQFTDKPVVRSIYTYDERPLIQGNESFELNVSAYNIRNKEDLKLQLLDGQKQVIAESVSSSYNYYDETRKEAGIKYSMEVLPGKIVKGREGYTARILNYGPELTNQAEAATFYTADNPRIIGIDTSGAAAGKIIADVINIDAGEVIKGELRYRYNSKNPVIKTAFAICNSKGQLNFDFKEPIGRGKYDLFIYRNDEYLYGHWFDIVETQLKKVSVLYSSPRRIPINMTEFDFFMNLDNVFLSEDLIAIEMLDSKGKVVGKADKSSIVLEQRDYYSEYYSIRMDLAGTMKINAGEIIKAGVYTIRLTHDGDEIKINSNRITVTDKPLVNGLYVEESVWREYYDGNSGLLWSIDSVSSKVKDLHVYMDGIYNVADKAKLKAEIHEVQFHEYEDEDGYRYREYEIGDKAADTAEFEISDGLIKNAQALFHIEDLSDGNYCIAVYYEDNNIDSLPFTITSAMYFNGFEMDWNLSPKAGEFFLDMYNTINVEPLKITVKAATMDGREHALKPVTDGAEEYNNGLLMRFDNDLPEAYYHVKVYYDGKQLKDPYYEVTQELLVSYNPVVIGTSSYDKKDYRISTLNYDPNVEYKIYLYEYNKDDNSDKRLLKTISAGKPDASGRLIFDKALIDDLPMGGYELYIHKADETIMGRTMLRKRNLPSQPPAVGAPKAYINSGQLYTASEAVKLYIDAAGYGLVKIANTEEELSTALYENVSPVMNWTLDKENGFKNVYLKFKQMDGKESSVITAGIWLDTVAPAAPTEAGVNGEPTQGGYVELFAKGVEKSVKAYADLYKGSEKIDTAALGYIKSENDKHEFSRWIQITEEYTDVDRIEFFFEDFAGNVSEKAMENISIKRLARLYGVVEKENGDRARYQAVLLQKKVGEEYIDYSWTYADGDGRYSFNAVPEGNYRLLSYAPRGYIDLEIEVAVGSVDKGQDIVFADKYKDEGNLKVTVKDTEDRPVKDAYIYISNWDIGEYFDGTTGDNGEAVINDIPAADYSIALYYGAYSYYESQEITIFKDKTTEIEFTVPVMGEIKGSVKDKDGSPVQNVDIYAAGTKCSYRWARTDSNGEYTMEVPKGDERYTVYVYTDNSAQLTANRRYTGITPDGEDIDFILYPKLDVSGVIKGSDSKNIETAIYASGIDNWSWRSTNSDRDGVFRFTKSFGAGGYQFNIWGVPGYYSKDVQKTITEEELEAGQAIDLGNITLESYSRDIFKGNSNNVRTDVSYVQKGKNITARVNYHNTKDADLSNVTIKASIPEGTSLVSGSGSLEKKIAKLKAGEKDELTFIIKVADDFAGSRITIKASAIYNGNASPIGYADVDVVSATINAPAEVKSSTAFKVYGEATMGSDVSIIAKNTADGKEAVIAFAKPNGRWYYTDIKAGLAAGNYKLYAKVTKGSDTGLSDYAEIAVKDDALTIEDIIITSPGGQKIGMNEESGVAAFSVWVDPQFDGKPIDVKVKFDQGEIPGHFEFVGKEFTADYNNGYMGRVIEGWSGSGIQKLYYVTDSGKRFIIAEITILIDPSGYVYDKYTGERIEGATVICEVKTEKGSWVKWDAAKYGQINPQLTDNEGKYGWMVPDGEYRIKVQKDGYEAHITDLDEDANLKSIIIPPPRMDVNIGLIDVSNPGVSRAEPHDGAEAGVDTAISVIFTKPMDTSTINNNTFKVTDGEGKTVNGTISFTDNDTRAVFTPAAALKHGEAYNVVLSGIKDKKDRSGASREIHRYTFSFMTNENIKTEYLKISEIAPADKATNVDKNTQILVTFDKELDAASINDKNIKLTTVSGEPKEISLSATGSKLTIAPQGSLLASTQYKVTIKSGVKSSAGLYLDKDYTYTFTTKYEGNGGGSGGSGGSGGGGGGGSSSGSTTPAPADPISKKVDEALNKGLKQVELEVSKEGFLELSKTIIDKLIDKKIEVVIKNGNLKAKIDIFSLKNELQGQDKVSITFKEKADAESYEGYTNIKALEFKITAGSKEIKPSKKTAIEIDLGALPNTIENRLKAGVYIKQGDRLVYINGSSVSKKGVVSFKCDNFGEFVIAEYNKKFNDMDKYGWAEEYVHILAARGVTTGIGENSFNPEGTVTRAQFAAFIARALGLEAKSSANPFSDVKGGQWFTEAIIAAAESGIIQGDGKGSFMPDQTVTREQMAVMIMRAYELKMGKYKAAAADFADMDSVSSYAKDGVSAAKALGIISGTGSGNFDPTGNAIRAASAKMIVKLLEYVIE